MAIHRKLTQEELEKNSAVFHQWRNGGEHLPHFLRDFHDQKDLFKFLFDRALEQYKEDPNPFHVTQNMSWVDGHLYTIDHFLWLMAEFGYTLQKSKKAIAFNDPEETIREFTNEQRKQMAEVLMSGIKKQEEEL